jgi:hypothetical protein
VKILIEQIAALCLGIIIFGGLFLAYELVVDRRISTPTVGGLVLAAAAAFLILFFLWRTVR